jgi:hypothetical protein
MPCYLASVSNLIFFRGRQLPQCEGANKHTRTLFNSKVRLCSHIPYNVHFDNTKKTYVLPSLGAVHGLLPGAEFVIYASQEDTASPLCTLIVKSVDSATSTLGMRDENGSSVTALPETAVAILSKPSALASTLLVNVQANSHTPPVRVTEAIFLVAHDIVLSWRVKLASRKRATLGIEHAGDSATFRILDKPIVQLGMDMLRFTVPATTVAIATVLRAAAPFFWQLRRAPQSPVLRHKIVMRVYKLCAHDDRLDSYLLPELRPVKPKRDILGKSEGMRKQAELGVYAPWTVVADGETPYGVEVQNNTTSGLFLSIFYFNIATLKIREPLRF